MELGIYLNSQHPAVDDPARRFAEMVEQVRLIRALGFDSIWSEDGRHLAAHIPGAQLYPFEGLGHLPVFTARREFRETLRQFVRTGEARPEAPVAPGG